jgi:serine/threonine-protein kinase
MLHVGQLLDRRYRIESLLGAGGMGLVASALHVDLGHRVAIKVLHEELAQNATTVERFMREARAVVNLRTDHVCRVFDVGRLESGAPYIVMELLEGVDLSHTAAKGPIPVSLAAEYISQACTALTEAHAAGIIHRDLKPANLFVTRRPDGSALVKVLDFGIAKATLDTAPNLTATTGMMGSPAFMSPEQIQSARQVDVRTDIWALGVTLYQLVSGRLPFAAPSLTELAIKVAMAEPDPIDCDPAMRAVILRCLDKDRERRYPTAAALAADLARFIVGRPSAPAPLLTNTAPAMVSKTVETAYSATGMTPAPPRRARWPWLVAGLVVAFGGGITALALTSKGTPAPREAGVVAVVPGDAADPWKPVDAPLEPVAVDATLPVDATVAVDAEVIEEDPSPAPDFADLQKAMEAQAKLGMEMAKQNCKMLLANKAYAAYAAMVPGLVACACLIGDPKRAQALLDKMTNKEQRAELVESCTGQGVKVH